MTLDQVKERLQEFIDIFSNPTLQTDSYREGYLRGIEISLEILKTVVEKE